MTQPRTPEHEDKLPTYQELLDEAVDETFPASDPISPSAAMNAGQPVRTGLDDRDWTLQPAGLRTGSGHEVVADFDDEQAARRARDEALAQDLPTARLELPPEGRGDGPVATLTVVTCNDDQQARAFEIARRSGAAHIAVKV